MSRRFLGRACLFALLAAALFSGPLAAGEAIAVIIARDAPTLSLDLSTLREVYLKLFQMDDQGRALIPVNLPPEHPLRRGLSEVLFQKSAQQLQVYWNQRYFQGISPPYVLQSEEAVVQFVAKTPGAIGYVAACHVDSTVRALLLIPAPADAHAAIQRLCPSSSGRGAQ